MMRDVLLDRIEPLVKRFAAELADLLVARIDIIVRQAEESIDIALSALASQLDDSDGNAGVHVAGADDSSTTAVSAVRPPRPTKRSKRAATPGQSATAQGASSAAGNVAEPHRAPGRPPQHGAAGVDTSQPLVASPKGKTCSKCGFVGGNARGCGTAHETRVMLDDILDDAIAAVDEEQKKTAKASRIAEIKKAARRHGLPTPRSSFDVNDRGDVSELDFGGAD